MDFLNDDVVQVIGTILGVAGVVVLRSLAKHVPSLIETLKKFVQGTEYGNSLTHALDVIQSVVTTAEHTILPQLLEASKDGKLTQEEIEKIVNSAKEEISKLINAEKQSLLNDFLGDYEAWVDAKVRSSVLAIANKVVPTVQIVAPKEIVKSTKK